MEKNEISEEVTVTPIIRDLERLFGRLVELIVIFVKFILSSVVTFVQFCFRNFLLLLIVAAIGGVLGFFSTEFIPRKYESSMIVKLNVDGKDQLMNDIGYFNALIEKKANKELSGLLSITETEASSLAGCEIYAHSTFTERTEALNELYKNTDTAVFSDLNWGELMQQNSSEFSSKFKITIKSTDQTLFSKLEEPLLAYLERVPEMNTLLESSQEGLRYQREVYLTEMQKLDTLSQVMNEAMLERSKHPGDAGSNTYINWGEQTENNAITPLDLQDRYIFYSQKVAKIDVQLKEHETCYFVSSHLAPYGKKIGYGRLSRAISVALVFFALTCLVLFLRQFKKKTA